jgi:hypothetical protein
MYIDVYLSRCLLGFLFFILRNAWTYNNHAYTFSFSFLSFVFFYYSFSTLWIKIDHHCDEFSRLVPSRKETLSRAREQVAVKMKYVSHFLNDEWISLVHRCLTKDYVRTFFTACTTRTCARVCRPRPFRPRIHCAVSCRNRTSVNRMYRWSVTRAQYCRLADRHSKRV